MGMRGDQTLTCLRAQYSTTGTESVEQNQNVHYSSRIFRGQSAETSVMGGATVPHLMPHPKTSHFPSSLVLQLLLCDRASVFVLGLVCFLVTRTGLLSYFVWHVFHVYYEFD